MKKTGRRKTQDTKRSSVERSRARTDQGEAPTVEPSGESELYVRKTPDPLFAVSPPIVESVLFSRVGHTFGPFPPYPGTYIVQDYLLDETGGSGGDGKLRAIKTFDLTTSVSYRVDVFPKDQKKRVMVTPPPSTPVFVSFEVGRRFVNAASDVADTYPATSFYTDLQGPAPIFTYNFFFIGRNTNHWVHFVEKQEVSKPFAFLGYTTVGVYPARSFDPGLKSYKPVSWAHPFNLPWPTSPTFFLFGYLTQSSVDPGPFVTLS